MGVYRGVYRVFIGVYKGLWGFIGFYLGLIRVCRGSMAYGASVVL